MVNRLPEGGWSDASNLRALGDFIRNDILLARRLSITQAAKILGVGRQALSDLVNGRANLSPEMALRIEKAFGIPMENLLRMQAWQDAIRMRKRADEIDVRKFEPQSFNSEGS